MSGANSGDYSDFALVTISVGDTDPWMLQQVHTESLTLRPPILPICSIPHVVFGHVRLGDTNLSPEELVDILEYFLWPCERGSGSANLIARWKCTPTYLQRHSASKRKP